MTKQTTSHTNALLSVAHQVRKYTRIYPFLLLTPIFFQVHLNIILPSLCQGIPSPVFFQPLNCKSVYLHCPAVEPMFTVITCLARNTKYEAPHCANFTFIFICILTEPKQSAHRCFVCHISPLC